MIHFFMKYLHVITKSYKIYEWFINILFFQNEVNKYVDKK